MQKQLRIAILAMCCGAMCAQGTDRVEAHKENPTPDPAWAELNFQIYLAESDHAPFGKIEPLAILKTNADGAGSAQAIGPLKTLSASGANAPSRRFLIVTDPKNPSQVVLRQASGEKVP